MTLNLYFLEHTRWSTDDGTYTARAFSTHDVSEDVARRALDCGAAILSTDPRVLQYVAVRGISNNTHYQPQMCIDLDQIHEGETLMAMRMACDSRLEVGHGQ
jgi:hypothetical protein